MTRAPVLRSVSFVGNDLARFGLGSRPLVGRMGRVRTQHRIDWEVVTAEGDLRAPLASREVPRPAVGDWVRLADDAATITEVLPRTGALVRRAAGPRAAPQILAANVDVCFVLVPLSGPPNVRRLERTLALVLDAAVRPVVVLTKSDLALVSALDAAVAAVQATAGEAMVHPVSAVSGDGLPALEPYFSADATVALLGASGSGKSSLVNRWLGDDVLSVGTVRDKDQKGRHTTTRRELFVRPAGGVVVDTPGTREVGLWDADEGVDEAFADIVAYAGSCRFSDCAHQREPGCAVRAAVVAGALEVQRVERYLRVRAGTSTRRPRSGH